MTAYNAQGLVYNPWPPLEHLSDGRWQRVWRIRLTGPVPCGLQLDVLSAHMSETDCMVSVQPIGERELTVTVLTKEHGWSDVFYFATYRMFAKIDECIGTIESIEGQPRDMWRPWRK